MGRGLIIWFNIRIKEKNEKKRITLYVSIGELI